MSSPELGFEVESRVDCRGQVPIQVSGWGFELGVGARFQVENRVWVQIRILNRSPGSGVGI